MRVTISETLNINQISRIDRDSLHTLPLAMLPIDDPALKRARLIKNARLNSVVEIFSDKNTGSGQLDIDGLIDEFGWNPSELPKDFTVIQQLSEIPSYDVYSLRINLRELGIEVTLPEALSLSKEKTDELNAYMTDFTHPLIVQIYGDDDDITNFQDVLKKFNDPNFKEALKKIQLMSEKLGVRPDEIPTFMENYGDIFLSLSYYRECLDSINPILSNFLAGMTDLKNNFQLKSDKNLMAAIDPLVEIINDRIKGISSQFKSFDEGNKTMWENISAQKFEFMKNKISSQHTSIGGALCALSVKLDAWNNLFPDPDTGGPGKRAEFIMLEMRQGIDKIVEINQVDV